MGRDRPGDVSVIRDGKVRGLVAGRLENDDRETKLKDDLQRDERVERVVVPLLSRREEVGDQGKGADPGQRRPASCQYSEGDGAIQPEDTPNPCNP